MLLVGVAQSWADEGPQRTAVASSFIISLKQGLHQHHGLGLQHHQHHWFDHPLR
jgi:hypothetical protein